MENRSNTPEEVSRSTFEAYTAIAIAVLTVVFEINWEIKVVLLAVLTLMLCDLCWRLKFTIKLPKIVRGILMGIVIFGIFKISYEPIKAQYNDEKFPLSRKYLDAWGLNSFSLKQGSDPPIVASGDAEAFLKVNGHLLIDRKNEYNLVGICFNHIARQDSIYDTNLSKSGLYTIRDNRIEILIPLTIEFLNELQHGSRTPSFMLLAIPRGVRPDQFSNVAEAEALGGRVLSEGSSSLGLKHVP